MPTVDFCSVEHFCEDNLPDGFGLQHFQGVPSPAKLSFFHNFKVEGLRVREFCTYGAQREKDPYHLSGYLRGCGMQVFALGFGWGPGGSRCTAVP